MRQHRMTGWAEYRRSASGVFGLAVLGICVVLALTAPLFISRGDLTAISAPGSPFQPPSARFPLGTDSLGRSMVDVTIWGARISLTVGFLATFMSVGIGTVTGVAAGHFRGWAAAILMRVTDWFLVLPTLVLAAALASVLRPGISTVILAIGITSWPSTTRLVRAQTLTLEERPYVERARALGGGHLHVITRHVLPGVMPIVLAQATLSVAGAILAEATLAFLGLSDSTKVSWGTALEQAHTTGAVSAGYWWMLLPPGIAIAVVSLAFTLCGRAMEAALNPRLRGQA